MPTKGIVERFNDYRLTQVVVGGLKGNAKATPSQFSIESVFATLQSFAN
jgi:hypothetical protein